MRGGRPLPILVYHNVAEPPPGVELRALYVTPSDFARQMRLLARLGWRGVSLGEGLEHLWAGGRERLVAITLDDGYRDNLENALPVLERFGFRATCYVASGALGSYNHWDAERLRVRKPVMSAVELRGWAAAGMEVGAHTRSHPHLPDLPSARVREEVGGSKADLEALLGVEVAHFCYPYGEFDPQAVEAVREAGFRSATTLRRARARTGDDPLRLPRVLVRDHDPLPRLLLKLLTPYEDWRGRADARRRARSERRDPASAGGLGQRGE